MNHQIEAVCVFFSYIFAAKYLVIGREKKTQQARVNINTVLLDLVLCTHRIYKNRYITLMQRERGKSTATLAKYSGQC